MRKFLILLLLASAAIPAAVSAQDGGHRGPREEGGRTEQRDSSSNDRPQRAERAQRPTSSEPAMRVDRAERPARTDRAIGQGQSIEPVRQIHRVERDQPAQNESNVRRAERDQSAEPGRVRRNGGNDDGFAVRRPPREARSSPEAPREVQAPTETQVAVHRDGDRDGSGGVHDGTVRDGDRSDSNRRWSSDWRRDHRYDWRNYRSRYGSLYRLGRYYDPYGWGYRRWSIGLSLWPSYYGSNFWMNDPWQYRLPPAYGPYRWVRYYNDALLVNIYTGQVVDVIHSFFW